MRASDNQTKPVVFIFFLVVKLASMQYETRAYSEPSSLSLSSQLVYHGGTPPASEGKSDDEHAK